MPKLEGRVALITGAARGQGRSHALRLAEEGADIIAIDIDEQMETVPYPTATALDLDQTVDEVKALGRRILPATVDVRDLAGLQRVAKEGVDAFGRLDIVIANAGISSMAPAISMEEEMWQTMIDVNLTGVWKTVRAATPHIVAGGRGGSIVLTSSVGAMWAHENIAHYAAAKAGLVGLMLVLAKELGPQSIRVNTVHPSTVETPMVINDAAFRLFRPDLDEPTKADFMESAAQFNRLPITMMQPIDISNAIVHLVSDEGRYVTGTMHVIDAGSRLT